MAVFITNSLTGVSNTSRVLKNVNDDDLARHKIGEEAQFIFINEHSKPIFNAARASKLVFQ